MLLSASAGPAPGGASGTRTLPPAPPARWTRRSEAVPRGHLPAAPGHQGGEVADADGLLDEAHRAVAEHRVGPAGVEGVGGAAAVAPVIRVGVSGDVLAAGAVDGARPREDGAVAAGADQRE